MQNRISIITGPLARQLADAYAARRDPFRRVHADNSATVSPHNVLQVTARPCWRSRAAGPTGTVLIEAHAPIRGYGHTGGFGVGPEAVRYVRNATPDRIRAHAADLLEQVRQARAALPLALRERVYQEAERRAVPDDWDTDPAHGGRPPDYDRMTESDCHYWLGALAALPDKPAAAAA